MPFGCIGLLAESQEGKREWHTCLGLLSHLFKGMVNAAYAHK